MSKARLFTAMLSIVLVFSILFAGCKGSENQNGEAESSSEQTELSTSEQETQAEKSEAQVVDSFSKSGKYTPVDFGSELEYSFSIPRLEDDSDDARKINADIEKIFLSLAKKQLQLIENNEWADCLRIEWSAERSKQTVNIILRADNGLSFTEYSVYSYDTKTQKQLTNIDMLEFFGISEEEYITCVVKAAEKFFIEQNSEIPKNERAAYGYYNAFESIPSFITLDSTMPYIGADEGLKVIAPVASFAGNDWYYFTLEVSLDTAS